MANSFGFQIAMATTWPTPDLCFIYRSDIIDTFNMETDITICLF